MPSSSWEEGGLPAAGDAGQGYEIAAADVAGDILQHIFHAVVIPEGYVVQMNLVEVFQGFAGGFGRQAGQLGSLPGERSRRRPGRGQVDGVGDRPLYAADQLDHGCQGPVSQVPVINIDAAPDHAEQPGEVENQSHAAVHADAETSLTDLLLLQSRLPAADLPGRPVSETWL